MLDYNTLLEETPLPVYECNLLERTGAEGLYYDDCIYIEKNLPSCMKKIVLAEEIAHYETSVGNILDLQDIRNNKQEYEARRLAYERLVTLDNLVKCYKQGLTESWQIAEYLELDTKFVEEAIENHKVKHGLHFTHGDYFFRFTGNQLEVFSFLEE